MFTTLIAWAVTVANTATEQPKIPPQFGIPSGEVPVDVRPIVQPIEPRKPEPKPYYIQSVRVPSV